MSFEDYDRALKMGKRAYRNSIIRGEYPYLPVLDDILSVAEIRGDVNLGLVDIPLDRVVGTSNKGRTYSFASNFMPILDFKTEFGSKWSKLCDAHLDEGIHDPIKVYEYLNYFYVVEGNKRVSVLKYFDAVSIPAYVTRKVPKKTDDPENVIYYEFMDFNRITKVNFLWVSKPGNFEKILDLTYPEHKEGWTEDDLKYFTAFYYNFAAAFKEKGGEKLSDITTADAMISYLEVYDYEDVVNQLTGEIKQNISAIWQEFVMNTGETPVDINMNPPEEKKTIPIFSQLFNMGPNAARPLNVAFLYDKEPSSSGWLYGHELGRNHIKEVFGDSVSTLKVTCTDTGDTAVEVMEDLIENEGTEVIFTTTAELIDASLKVAVKYPNVKVLNCSINTQHRYIRTYDARLYEAKFLSGIIAGTLTGTDKLGYMADYPIYESVANINAFALGAKMVNPRARVYLRWTTMKDETRHGIRDEFYANSVDYVSDQDLIAPDRASRNFGLYKLSKDEPLNFAMPAYNWGALYEKIINIIIKGQWNSGETENLGRAVNYWWGLPSGVIDIILSKNVPQGVARLVETIKTLMAKEEFYPFEGLLTDQNGEVRNEDGNRMSADEVIRMDWLLDNVDGEIPVMSMLQDSAKTIVELKGVVKDDTSLAADGASVNNTDKGIEGAKDDSGTGTMN
ncbi:MAG: BMP family ABC transporter substrate-binding protein [Eubacterium sp.]|nr:BMP family ABC transporter substrate-binding protein [Eubacterium sp.]